MTTDIETIVPETSPATSVLSAEQKQAFNAGKTDLIKPKTEASAPSKTPSDRADVSADKAAPASEPGSKQEHKKTQTADERKAQLQREIQELTAQRNKLREPRGTSDVKREVTPSPAPQPEKKESAPKPTLEEKNPDGTPKFKSYGEYEDARDKWNREEAIREFQQTTEKERREAAQKAEVEAASKEWLDRVDETRKTLPDFDDVVKFDKDEPHPIFQLPQGCVLETFIYQAAEHGPQVLHHLMKDRAEYDRIMAIPSRLQLDRELWKLDHSFAVQSKSEPKPATPVTKAPKPVSEVGGRGTAASDPLEAEAKAHPGKLTRAAKAEADRQYAARYK